MRIYSMTATFGSLEHKTLTLKPGLNIIEAPNEWGKSTWCAFLVSMLYGLDTKARTTKTALADKERYAPWSGAPMSGRIDLNWNGRDITIERHSRGRLIFSEFSAYETATGLDVPELDGNNCGVKLLGVERSVFTRAGFLKLTDLPVTQDDALRRRLNSLVTTGDESGAGDKLQQALKDLKNKCRYNRTGLLPQAEAQRDQLENQLYELMQLSQQGEALRQHQEELESRLKQLESHKTHLRYAASVADRQKVAEAEQAEETAKTEYDSLVSLCQDLPSREDAEAALQTGLQLQQQWMNLQMESSQLPPLPQTPQVPAQYREQSPEAIVATAKEDADTMQALEKSRKRNKSTAIILAAGLFAVLAAAYTVLRFALALTSPALALGLGAGLLTGEILTIIGSSIAAKKLKQKAADLQAKYPGLAPQLWVTDAQNYANTMAEYHKSLLAITSLRGDLDRRLEELNAKISSYAQEESLPDIIAHWQKISQNWNTLTDAERNYQQAQNYSQTLRSMVKTVDAPTLPDTLTLPEKETDGYINAAQFELRQLRQKLGQTQGRSEALGQEALLQSQLRAVRRRIQKLEDTYSALEMAQKALSAATTELQRRFAPRISKRAQALFSKLTNSRYERLTLSEDLSLNTCTEQEDTLRAAGWRSDGTVDQLYLALRLAVAEELTPNAPLVLDDALVRFDDKRLSAALDILKETAENKQVILFTCQGREAKLQGDA